MRNAPEFKALPISVLFAQAVVTLVIVVLPAMLLVMGLCAMVGGTALVARTFDTVFWSSMASGCWCHIRDSMKKGAS